MPKEIVICAETGDYEIAERAPIADGRLRDRLAPMSSGLMFFYKTVGVEPPILTFVPVEWRNPDLDEWPIQVAARRDRLAGRRIIEREVLLRRGERC